MLIDNRIITIFLSNSVLAYHRDVLLIFHKGRFDWSFLLGYRQSLYSISNIDVFIWKNSKIFAHEIELLRSN